MHRLPFPVCLVALAFLVVPGPAAASTILLGADSNMGNGVNAATPWVWPGDTDLFFENVLQGGSSVFIDPYTGLNASAAAANNDLLSFYNSLAGVTAVMPGGDFSSGDLSGVDLLITILPITAYTAAEEAAMAALLAAGGTVFFLGDNGNFMGNADSINDALEALGSSMMMLSTVINSYPSQTTSVNGAHPLMAGVASIGLGTSGSVSGGTALAFYGGHTVLAVEGAAQAAVPEPGSLVLVGTGLGTAGLVRRRRRHQPHPHAPAPRDRV